MYRQCAECQSDGISNKRGLSSLTFSAQLSFSLTVVLVDDRYVPQAMENVYVLLFQCVGIGSQLPQCNVSWLNMRLWFVFGVHPGCLRAMVGAVRHGQALSQL